MVEQNEKKIEADSNKQGIRCENSNEVKAIKPTFVNTFTASLIDLIVIGAISTVGVFVIDAVIKLAGYAVAQKFQMSFIIFMVVMVLYMSIMECGKTSATFGKKVSGLIITKR